MGRRHVNGRPALTLKEEKFCQEMVKQGNASAAYRSVYHSQGTPNTVACEASKLNARPHIAQRISEIEEEAGIAAGVTDDWVIVRLVDLVLNGKEGGTKARALELIGKNRNLWTDNVRLMDESEETLRARFIELMRQAKEEGIEVETLH